MGCGYNRHMTQPPLPFRAPGSAAARWAAALLLVFVFVICLYPNARGATSEGLLGQTSLDEPVTYPTVVRMLGQPSDLKDLWERWIIYGDYHYGYPFWFSSAAVLLPLRLINGAAWENFTGWNLLVLRQMISVLPMLVAVYLMARGMTGRRTTWETVFLTALVLSLRGVFRTFLQWWHPDALSILMVVLTLLFLQRDDLRFGRNFLYAAVACGVAAGIKLAGFFFAPAILAYLVAGWLRRTLTLPQMLGKAALFGAVMLGALVVSNPVVYNAGAREEILRIQVFKTEELDLGYSHDVSEDYAKGPQHWTWTFNRWFASPAILGVAALFLLVGCIWGPEKLLNRLILAFSLPMAVYLLWFVAVKPDHYWLPVFVPVFTAFLNVPRALREQGAAQSNWGRVLSLLVWAGAAAFLVWNILQPETGILAQYRDAMLVPGALPLPGMTP